MCKSFGFCFFFPRYRGMHYLLWITINIIALVNVRVIIMTKHWKITLGIAAGLTVVFAIIWTSPIGRFIIKGGLSELKEQPFEPQQWKAVRNSDPATLRIRMLMLDDLMENKLKTGIDSMAVKEMLGEPERHYGFSYSLGMITEGIDPMYLIVKFDSVGYVNKLDIESEGKLKGNSGAVDIQIR